MADTTELVRTIRFDPETPIDEASKTTTREIYADPQGRFKTGFWASAPGSAEVHYQKDELCMLIAGKVRLTDASGHAETYSAGETFLIPAGFKGLWETLEPTRKFYAIYKPD